MKNNKKIIIISLAVVVLVLIIGLTLAVWSTNLTQEDENTLSAKCFNITFTGGEEAIELGSYPQTNEEGLINKAYKVTIDNTCEMPISYNVILNVLTASDLDASYVNVAVDSNIINLSAAPTLTATTGVKKSYKIFSGFLPWKGKRTIKVRAWLDENAPQQQAENKTFQYKINVEGTSYNSEQIYLTKDILKKNKISTQKQDFNHASPENKCDKFENNKCTGTWVTTDYGSGLFTMEDDDGTSYYFRGDVDTNNVKFAKLDWKIIRINGDGTIRLILTKSIGNTSFNDNDDKIEYAGYTFNNEHDCTQDEPCISNYVDNKFVTNYGDRTTKDSTIKTNLEKWYESTLIEYDNQIALTTYCNDTSVFDYQESGYVINYIYGVRGRNFEKDTGDASPILTCPNPTEFQTQETHNYGGVYKLKVGTAAIDELSVAGYGKQWSGENADYKINERNYLSKLGYFRSMSPRYWLGDNLVSRSGHTHNQVFTYGYMGGGQARNSGLGLIPVINLRADTVATRGDGTSSNPYVIE